MKSRLLFTVLAGAVFLAVPVLNAGCGDSVPGLSRQRAVSEATTRAQGMSSTPVTFVSAASGRLGTFSTGFVSPNPNRKVWAVTFTGTFAGACGPAGNTCPPPNKSVSIFLDYTSGAFVMASTPAAGP